MQLSNLPRSRELAPAERLRFSIELTNICNFARPFCPQAHKHEPSTPAGAPHDRQQGRMSPELFARADHQPARLVFLKSSYNEGDEKRRFVEHWMPQLGPQDTILAKLVLSYGGKTADPWVEAHRCNV